MAAPIWPCEGSSRSHTGSEATSTTTTTATPRCSTVCSKPGGGIPISLSVVWMEVGRRAGIEVLAVALPGHFCVDAGGQLVDPFHSGEAIGFDEAASLVSASLGGPPRADLRWLEPVGTPALIGRMLRNLAAIDPARIGGGAWITECREALAADQ